MKKRFVPLISKVKVSRECLLSVDAEDVLNCRGFHIQMKALKNIKVEN